MNRARQSGAALALCLVLLTVLTLLATSTMSTATVQLTMSGNDQYLARAFEAAEAGIEAAIAQLAAHPPSSPLTLTASLDDGDSYSATVHPRGVFPPPPGYNATFTALHFEIESTGASHRDATAVHVQGLFLIQPPSTPPAADALPPLCMTGVEARPATCMPIGTAVRTCWRTRSR